jgi:hypothetical protein
LNIMSDDALDTSHVAHLFGTADFVGETRQFGSSNGTLP